MRFLVILGLLLAPTIVSAEPYTLTVATHGSSLDLTFHNQTAKPIKIPMRIIADFFQYDWLTVTLQAKTATRTLRFIADRDESGMQTVDLAPNGSHTETIDLIPWSIRVGDPLAPGDYSLSVAWDTTRQPNGLRATASTKLVIPAAVEKQCKGVGSTGLSLLARQVGKAAVVEVGLHNTGTTTICAYAKVLAGEIQSDWLTISITDPKDPKTQRQLWLDDTRTRSAYAYVELAPGATSWTRWDLAAWALRKRNGAAALPSGSTFATATYDSSSATDVWRGKVTTWFALALP